MLLIFLAILPEDGFTEVGEYFHFGSSVILDVIVLQEVNPEPL